MNQGRVCVGGHDLDEDFRSVRLLTKGATYIKESAGIDVGEIWELDYVERPEIVPPHIEDVLVGEASRVETLAIADVRDLILDKETPWRGAPDSIFDKTVTATESGRVYVPDSPSLPSRSTGYWLPDEELIMHMAFGKPKFLYSGSSALNGFTWAGVAESPARILPETLVRVSLARWHDPASAPAGYYVQISGVY